MLPKNSPLFTWKGLLPKLADIVFQFFIQSIPVLFAWNIFIQSAIGLEAPPNIFVMLAKGLDEGFIIFAQLPNGFDEGFIMLAQLPKGLAEGFIMFFIQSILVKLFMFIMLVQVEKGLVLF